MACGREAAGTVANRIDNDAGTIAPPPMACTSLAAINTLTPGASPHASDPTLNVTSPARNMRLRPIRSAQRPAGTSVAAKTIV